MTVRLVWLAINIFNQICKPHISKPIPRNPFQYHHHSDIYLAVAGGAGGGDEKTGTWFCPDLSPCKTLLVQSLLPYIPTFVSSFVEGMVHNDL